MMDKDTYIEIAGKIAEGTASEKEIELYNAYFNAYQLKYPSWNELDALQRKEMIDEAEEGIHVQLRHSDDKKSVRLWPRIAVAAAAVAAITLGVWLYYASSLSGRQSRLDVGNPGLAMNDIAPGKNGATITLSNGKVIQLSDAKTGVVVGKDLKYNDGAAVQGGGPDLRQDDVMQLTATTAKGQTYQFTLPDGTKVWLNADSKISFPSRFPGQERKILLSGEAYFEVAKVVMPLSAEPLPGQISKPATLFKVPFLVESKGQTVEVLGTHFNISAYQDERLTTTTLVEGSVRVSMFDVALGRRTEMLKPNQQSIQTPGGGMQVRNVDVSEALDWKNGLFIFNDEPLQNVMRRVARWYDVEVSYDGVDQNELYGGSVSRYDNVSKVLRKLELTGGIHFKIEGRKIKVMK